MNDYTQQVVVDKLCNEIKTHPRKELLLYLIYSQLQDLLQDQFAEE